MILLGVLAVALTATIISPALGGPGFLTNKAAKKTFFTKKKTNQLFLRKSSASSSFYTKSQANSTFLPASGDTTLQISPDNWVAAGSATVTHFSGEAQLKGSSGTEFFNAALNLPTVLQGRAVKIDDFELCYSATNAGAKLDRVFLFVVRNATASNAIPSAPGETPIDDNTDRTDSSCRTYAAASPVAIGPNDFAQVVVRNAYTSATNVVVGRLTVHLST
jgi:hypothetical protein